MLGGRKKTWSLLVALLILLLVPVPHARATNLTGTFKNPDGSAVNGKLILLLSQPARLSDSSAQVVPMVKIFSVTNGVLEVGAFVYGNDVLVPAGTYYLARLVDSNNNLLFEQKWSITGTNLDLGTLTPTTTGVVLPDPLIKNVTTTQSVQGPVTFNSGVTAFSLTLNGNLNPGSANAYDLGSATTPWREIHAQRTNDTFRPGTAGGTVTAPSQVPALVAITTGGSIAAGTYYCVITYGNRNGETTASPQASIVVSGSTNRIYGIPGDFNYVTGAYKMRMYCGTVSGGPYFLQTPLTVSTAIGTITVTSNVATLDTSTTRHGLVDGDVFSITGATDASFNGTGLVITSVSEPTSGNSTITYAFTHGDGSTTGGNVNWSSAIETDWRFVLKLAEEGLAISTVALSGSNPPSTNTATIGSLQVAVNQLRTLNGTSLDYGKGEVRLSRTTYTLTTPLIAAYAKIFGADTAGSNGGPASGTVITDNGWANAAHLGVVMTLGPLTRMEDLEVHASVSGNTNPIVIGYGGNDGGFLMLRNVSFYQRNTTNASLCAIKGDHIVIAFDWYWEQVSTLGGLMKNALCFTRSVIADWNWDGGRWNSGSSTASDAVVFKTRAGSIDQIQRVPGALNVPGVALTVRNVAVETAERAVVDVIGGGIQFEDWFLSADPLTVAGTPFLYGYANDFWTNPGSGNYGFIVTGMGAQLTGSADATVTVKNAASGPIGMAAIVVSDGATIQGSGGGSGIWLDQNNKAMAIRVYGSTTGSAPGLDANNPASVNAPRIINPTTTGLDGNQRSGIGVGDVSTTNGRNVNNYLAGGTYFGITTRPDQGFNVLLSGGAGNQVADWYGGNALAGNSLFMRWASTPGTSTDFITFAEDGVTQVLRALGNAFGDRIEIGGPPAAGVGNGRVNIRNAMPISWANAAGTSPIRVLELDAANNVLLGEGTGNAVLPRTASTPLGSSGTRWGSLFLNNQLDSSLATGTPPFVVASTSEVANLNAQRWHGYQAIDFSATLDFGSISAQTCAELTITATGAAANNPIVPSWPPALEAGLAGIMRVSSANTITVRLCNVTTSAVDPASQTYAGRVIQ